MKATVVIAFTCVMLGSMCRADSLDAQTEQEIRRELCRIEFATKQVAQSQQRRFMKTCASELKIAAQLGEFYYDPNFYPEGFGQWVVMSGNASSWQQ
jgi:hypothetical protein